MERGLLKARGKQRTDSTHVLAAVRMLNRLETVGETLRHALNVLAEVAPDWLLEQAPPEWYERYATRMDNYRFPKEEPKRQALAAQIGGDGFTLLAAVYAPTAPIWLREVPAVAILRQVWVQQYYGPQEPVRFREQADTPPSALLIHSPYDAEAHFATKRNVSLGRLQGASYRNLRPRHSRPHYQCGNDARDDKRRCHAGNDPF